MHKLPTQGEEGEGKDVDGVSQTPKIQQLYVIVGDSTEAGWNKRAMLHVLPVCGSLHFQGDD